MGTNFTSRESLVSMGTLLQEAPMAGVLNVHATNGQTLKIKNCFTIHESTIEPIHTNGWSNKQK